jgi:sugar lactone lactonase YvrE
VLNSIRVDERDNIWAVSSEAQEIFKISAEGQVLLRFGKQEAMESAEPVEPPRAPAARQRVGKPADIAWDKRGHVFVVDADYDQPRILKFDARGRFLAATGRKGSRAGELDGPHSMATDSSGNVYVADSGNARIQVFDNSLNPRAVYRNIGTPWAMCITNGSPQFLYTASNPAKNEGALGSAEIYKLELDGTILGRAGGDEFGASLYTLDHIHCHQANTIFGMGARSFYLITFAR